MTDLKSPPVPGAAGTGWDVLDRVAGASAALIGTAAPDSVPGIDHANWLSVSRFVEATGDVDPLYTDVQYGAGSIHSTLLAPPTFVLAVRSAVSSGGLDTVPAHGLTDRVASMRLTWSDTIRLADRLDGRVAIEDVTADDDLRVEVRTAARYTANGTTVAHGGGTVVIEAPSGPAGRGIHHYPRADVDRLIARLEAERPPRGGRPRFWSATAVGEELPVLLKGPLTFSDLFVWTIAEARPVKAGNLHRRDLAHLPGRRTANPHTGWPDWDRYDAWLDSAASDQAGLPAPAAPAGLVFSLAGQHLTYWAGDHGFLRRLRVRMAGPLLYGDALDLSGTVTGHSVTTDERGRRHHGVHVRTRGTNQLGEPVFDADATVLLPEPGRPVALPVHGLPHPGGQQ